MSVYGLSCQTGSRRLKVTGQVRSSALTMLAQIKRNDEDPQQPGAEATETSGKISFRHRAYRASTPDSFSEPLLDSDNHRD